MKTCQLSWCDNAARARGLCQGHYGLSRKYGVPNPASLAHIIGQRTLLGVTCRMCGEFKSPDDFYHKLFANGRRYWSKVCKPCMVIYNKSHGPLDPEKWTQEQRLRAQKQHAETLENAHHHYVRYTQADLEIMFDPDLTIRQKADKLGRTFNAIANYLHKDKKKREQDERESNDASS